MTKYISIRILGLVLIVLVLNEAYKNSFYQNDLQQFAPLQLRQDSLLKKNSVLYYAASSEYSFSQTDTNTKSISQLINFFNQTNQVGAMSSAAHHVGIFKPLILQLSKMDVSGIILMLNYRSFSPEWLESNNENHLMQSTIFYQSRPAIVNRLFYSLNTHDPLSPSERDKRIDNYFDNWKLPYEYPKDNIRNWCAVEKYGDWRNPKRQLADHYIKNYGFVIESSHPRISDFDVVTKHCSSKDIPLYLVILPENTDQANELIGPDLTDLMNTNADYLINRYHKPTEHVFVINLMNQLSDSCFFERDYPTEHYTFEGRNKIAQAIAEKLSSPEHDN